MIYAEQITLKNKQRWNKLLKQSLYPSYRQSIEYENSKEINNRSVTSNIFNKNGEDIAGVHYSIKYSRFLKTADILSGFVFKYEPTKELLEYIINHFIEFAKANHATYIRINPWLPQIIKDKKTDYPLLFNDLLKQKKIEILKEGRHTYWIDLSKDEDEILKLMKKQTRYEVKQALKSEIFVEIFDKPHIKYINEFWEQYKFLGRYKGFNMYNENDFKHELYSLLDAGLAYLYILYYKNRTINFSFASNFGISSYMHGAINYDFKKIEGCPSPGQFAQWKMITTSKKNNAKFYDLGFCPGSVPQKEHPSYKIWRFKYGFGGDHVQFLPIYGMAIQPLRGRMFKFIKYKK